ncbi:MAG: YfhO family protein, partial [Chloroflexi bacterium]|nr:YfhO family protein [Chloroflexota bacterium]
GFGSFRVPSRWLLVYTFGASILAAVGADWLVRNRGRGVANAHPSPQIDQNPQNSRSGSIASFAWLSTPRSLLVGLGLPLALVALMLLGQRQSRWLLLIWGGLILMTLLLAAGALLLPRLRETALVLLVMGGLAELWVANADLEHRHPIPNLAYRQPRESTSFLQSREGLDGPFRMLSIATPEYEVKETPEYRERFGWLHPEALKNLLVAVKWNEALLPNVPLEYGLPSADGYDGGVLPLASFSALTTAMLPDRARPDGVLASRLDHLPEAAWLDLFGARYVLAGRVKDLTRDGLYYDRAITRTLRPGEHFELRGLPLGAFTRLGMISSFRGPPRPGQEVGRVELRGEGLETTIPLLDGLHSAVGEAHGPLTPGPSLEPVPEWGAGDFGDATDWLTQLRFPHQPVTSLTIANTSSDLVLDVRALNLVDDVRQASFSLTLDDTVERTEFFDMKVYERRDALPRAYLVARAEVLDDAAALQRLAAPGFDPRDGALLAPSEGVRPLNTSPPDPGSAVLELSEPERVRIRTKAAGATYLVLSDSWYPGWVATVDGQQAPIARANVLFRAVEVPAGEHLVEFLYRPTSFILGSAVSASSVIIGLGWWLLVARRYRRAPG